jgi:hypothetical protein
MDGNGVMKCPKGSVYEGEFADDMKHGQGKITWPSGKWYDG